MQEMRILSIKLNEKGDKGALIKTRTSRKEGGDNYHDAIHPKFKKAMDALKTHLILLSGYRDMEHATDKDFLETVQVNGFHYNKKETAVIIVGGCTHDYGQRLKELRERIAQTTDDFLF